VAANTTGQRPSRVFVGWALASAVAVLLAIGAAATAPVGYRSPARSCASITAEIPEDYQDFTEVQGSWTWFPVGLTCTWTSSSGTFRAGPSWWVTMALAAPLLTGGGMLVHTASASRRRHEHDSDADDDADADDADDDATEAGASPAHR